jgi:hypothetical protein
VTRPAWIILAAVRQAGPQRVAEATPPPRRQPHRALLRLRPRPHRALHPQRGPPTSRRPRISDSNRVVPAWWTRCTFPAVPVPILRFLLQPSFAPAAHHPTRTRSHGRGLPNAAGRNSLLMGQPRTARVGADPEQSAEWAFVQRVWSSVAVTARTQLVDGRERPPPRQGSLSDLDRRWMFSAS